MSVVHNGPTESWITPNGESLAPVIDEFLRLSVSSIRACIYGWTDDAVYASYEASDRARDTQGLIDASQCGGRVQHAKIATFFTTINRFTNGIPKWVIGTSDGNIIHGKWIVANLKEGDPLPSTKSFPDWRTALMANYPVVLRGSYNWSNDAPKQGGNNIDISPSAKLAAMYLETYAALRQQNIQRHPQWNTSGANLDTLVNLTISQSD